MIDDPIVHATLTHVAKLFDDPPAFCLPIFSTLSVKSAHLIQCSTLQGSIEGFTPIDLDDLSVQAIEQTVDRRIGDQVILAFETYKGSISVGTHSSLKSILRPLLTNSLFHERPFTRSSVAKFCDEIQIAWAADLDAIDKLSGALESQKYFRINVLGRERIKAELRGDEYSIVMPSFRLREVDGALKIEIDEGASDKQIVGIQKALSRCEDDLRSLVQNENFSWEFRVVARPKITDIKVDDPLLNQDEPPKIAGDRSNTTSLRNTFDSQNWGLVWTAALAKTNPGSKSELLSLGLEWLKGREDHHQWSVVWRKLVDEQFELNVLLRLGRSWLDRPELTHRRKLKTSARRSSWRQVWFALWQAEPDDHLRLHGLRVLDKIPDNSRSWAFIWNALWQARPDDDLYVRGRRALDEIPPNRSPWRMVWNALWQAKPDDDLRMRGRRALDEFSADHNSWGVVWNALWQARPDEDLRLRGSRILHEISANHSSWRLVWNALLQVGSDDDLRERGLKALDEIPVGHGAWAHMWHALWQAAPSDNLREHGLKALDEIPVSHGAWGHMWHALWQAAPSDDLRERGLKTLDEIPSGNGAWRFIWKSLWQATPADYLRERGLKALDEIPVSHGAWGHIWQILWRATPSDNLRERGLKTLDEIPASDGAWKFIWKSLWQSAPGDDLRERGLKALDEIPASDGAWKFIWKNLWQATPGDDLRERGLKALDEIPANDGAWRYVWQFLWQAIPRDDLRERGRRALDDTDLRHASWGEVWKSLWSFSQADSDERVSLRSIAINWLQTTALNDPVWVIVWNMLWDEGVLEKDRLRSIAGRLLVKAPPKYDDSVTGRLRARY